MTRTILAIAALFLSASTLFAPAAMACVSCNYTPEVVNTPTPGMRAKVTGKKRMQVAMPDRDARKAAKRAAKIETAAAEPVVKKAEAIAAETQSANEPKHIPTASLLEKNTGATTPEAAPAAPEQKVAQDIGCKKFIPAASVTITVPCE